MSLVLSILDEDAGMILRERKKECALPKVVFLPRTMTVGIVTPDTTQRPYFACLVDDPALRTRL